MNQHFVEPLICYDEENHKIMPQQYLDELESHSYNIANDSYESTSSAYDYYNEPEEEYESGPVQDLFESVANVAHTYREDAAEVLKDTVCYGIDKLGNITMEAGENILKRAAAYLPTFVKGFLVG